jgi:prepilin signal peptidase PulO-like enzyme (type II secretory pathway)
VLGVALGWLSWDAVLTGTSLALVTGAVVGMVVHRRRGPSAAFAFGPALLAATWLTVLA